MKVDWETVVSVAIALLIASAIMMGVNIVLGKQIKAAKDHFENADDDDYSE